VLDEKLTLQRRDYTGNELKTNGYYYVFRNENLTSVYFFYRNGIALYLGGYSSNNLDYVESNLIKEFGKTTKDQWGVFIVNGNSIQYESWTGSSGFSAALDKRSGNIKNDTTIHFTERYSSEYKTTRTIDEVWHFKQFNSKPDSTNNFIK